jgi:DNA-binding response OmpR family regulator
MPESAQVPIVVVSVVHDDQRGPALGLLHAIPKPFDEAQLVGTVNRLLQLGTRRRVLVVDDDPGVLRLLTAVLSKAGFEILTAPDGRRALDLARREELGLILLDLRMAGLDGFAVLRALKADPGTADVPVVVMTGSEGARAVRSRVLTLGAADFMTKPFHLSRLVEVVRTLTGGN